MCRVVGVGTSFQMVMHGKLQPMLLQRSFIGFCVHTGDCAWQNLQPSSILIQCCRIVVGHLMLRHTQSTRNLAWNEQWCGVAVLCTLPTSSVRPFGWDWGPLWSLYSLCWVFSALICFLKERCELPQSMEFCWFLDWQKCVTNPDHIGSLSFGSGCNEKHNFIFMTSWETGVHEAPLCVYLCSKYCFPAQN